MITSAKGRTVVATLLLAALLPVFVVKAFHRHDACAHSSCCTHHEHEQTDSHDDDDCSICLFHLLPFTQSELFRIRVFTPVADREPVAAVYETVRPPLYTYALRAPPCV
ncbi:hypothetical protein [Tannerella sp.]|uniref:hypothetical protein n=1 Tax=Tannerella sp. TaxID=2382127 RepID=UPI0026DD498F|nr:hypothetical protein [Tannerella sp.]MDO4703692.1 hypothetical protein [Tannerella sp.]